MSDIVKDNIMLRQSMDGFHAEVAGRFRRALKSLDAVQKKDGLYAWEHRRLISMYREVLGVIEEHQQRAEEDKKQPLPPVDAHGVEILF